MGLRATSHAPYLLQCTLHFRYGSDAYLKEQKASGTDPEAGKIRGDLEGTELASLMPFRRSGLHK
jgi:hypothetical protein